MGHRSKSKPHVGRAGTTVGAIKDGIPCQLSGSANPVANPSQDYTPSDRSEPLAGLTDDELDRLIQIVMEYDD